MIQKTVPLIPKEYFDSGKSKYENMLLFNLLFR